MKNVKLLPIIAIAMMVMSCSSSESEEAPQSGKVTVTFNVSNYEQVDMDDAETRSTAITNLYWLTLGIYDANTLELVTDTVTQYYTDDGFGSFTVTLEYGSYKVLVLGYTNTRQPDMTNPKAIVFDEGFVPNLFSNMSDLTVDAETIESQTIMLSRVVAGFRVKFADAVPTTLARMHIVADGGSYILNSTTGYADEVATRTQDNTTVNSSTEAVIIYAFLTDEEATMDITYTAYDNDGNMLASHHFTDVPMKINQLTTYSGNFFTPETGEGDFSVGLAHDFDWENEVNYTYNFSD